VKKPIPRKDSTEKGKALVKVIELSNDTDDKDNVDVTNPPLALTYTWKEPLAHMEEEGLGRGI
jgi:hypothetical protein